MEINQLKSHIANDPLIELTLAVAIRDPPDCAERLFCRRHQLGSPPPGPPRFHQFQVKVFVVVVGVV